MLQLKSQNSLGLKIQTDKDLAHNIPYAKVVEKKQVWLINVAIPGDDRVDLKEMEKIFKHPDVEVKVKRIWEKKAAIVLVVICALGSVPRKFMKQLKTLRLDNISPS